MNKESRREYNKKYYAEKKSAICAKLFEKEECLKCGRIVSHQNMKKHQASKVCMTTAERRQAKLNVSSELEAIKQELEDIKKSKQDDSLKHQLPAGSRGAVSKRPSRETDPLMYCWGCQESFPESQKTKHKCSSKHRNL